MVFNRRGTDKKLSNQVSDLVGLVFLVEIRCDRKAKIFQ